MSEPQNVFGPNSHKYVFRFNIWGQEMILKINCYLSKNTQKPFLNTLQKQLEQFRENLHKN